MAIERSVAPKFIATGEKHAAEVSYRLVHDPGTVLPGPAFYAIATMAAWSVPQGLGVRRDQSGC